MSQLNMKSLEDDDEKKRLNPHLNDQLNQHVIRKMPTGKEGKFGGVETSSIKTGKIFKKNVFDNIGFDPTEALLESIDQSFVGKVDENVGVDQEEGTINELPMVNGNSLKELENELFDLDDVSIEAKANAFKVKKNRK